MRPRRPRTLAGNLGPDWDKPPDLAAVAAAEALPRDLPARGAAGAGPGDLAAADPGADRFRPFGRAEARLRARYEADLERIHAPVLGP